MTRSTSSSRKTRTPWIIFGCLSLLFLFACGSAAVVWGTMQLVERRPQMLGSWRPAATNAPPSLAPTLAPTAALFPTPTSIPAAPTEGPLLVVSPTPLPGPAYGFLDAPKLDQRYISPAAREDLARLLAADYPARDYYEVFVRLSSKKLRGRTVPGQSFELGERRSFQVGREQVAARLLFRSERAYFWVDERLEIGGEQLRPVGARLDQELYGQMITLFGQEPQAGIDGVLPFHIVHLAEIDTRELGFFDSTDQYPRDIFSNSNELDVVYLNMAELEVGEKLYYGTLVHEMQHLLHWLSDPNETTWLDEGLAQVAEVYAGLDTFIVSDYLSQPDLQLNSWSVEEHKIYGHYAASALFAIYFWEQLGDEALRDLAHHPADGMASVNAILQKYRPGTTLEAFLSDWYVANYVRQPAGSRYGYEYAFRRPKPAAVLRESGSETLSLNQYGVRYVDLDLAGRVQLSFAGDTLVDLIEAPARSGEKLFLAPPVNSMSASLTRLFDLTSVSTATLSFWTWYDLEADYDYAYVTISTNGGRTWQVLSPEHGKSAPFGSGLNGRSGANQKQQNGWVYEEISLRSYVGQQVLLRFEVLTDSAIAGRGLALDDIAVPEVGYFTDFEVDDGGWTAAGFVRSGVVIPQQWSLQLISHGEVIEVAPLPLDDFNQGRWEVNLSRPATLVVAPMTPFTSADARYWFEIEPLP